MHYLFMLLLTVGIVAADQIVKFFVVEQIPLHSFVTAIDGIFHLTYVRNTGAAFSSFQGMQWLFALIFLLFTAGIIWVFVKNPIGFTTFDFYCVAAIFGGGLGNMIDRLRFSYVVDMICLDFMEFPVFNIADCFITCGCIVLMVHLIFFNKAFWKDEKKK